MPTQKEYRHPISFRERSSAQMELEHDSYVGQSPLSEDLESKLRNNQARLEQLQKERDEVERFARELEELNSKKSQFLSSQVEVSEKLTNALTLIDRELLAMRTEVQELEQCREAFEINIKKIAKYDPESWTRDNMHGNLDKALTTIDNAADEYDQAARYFATKYSAAVFGGAGKKNARNIHPETGEFLAQLKNGLAFNLPLISIGILALLIYVLK